MRRDAETDKSIEYIRQQIDAARQRAKARLPEQPADRLNASVTPEYREADYWRKKTREADFGEKKRGRD